jgi:hypothetical protein
MTCTFMPEPKGFPYMRYQDDPKKKNIAKYYCTFQGPFINCHLIASLSSLAWINDNFIKDPGSGKTVYSFTFYDPDPIPVKVNSNICIDNSTGIWCCSQGCDETWVAMYEKAFAKFCMYKIKGSLSLADLQNSSVDPKYASLPNGSDWGGNPANVLKYLSDKTVKKYWYLVANNSSNLSVGYSSAYAMIKAFCDFNTGIGKFIVAGFGKMTGIKVKVPMGAWTYKDETYALNATGVKITYDNATIVADHCYSVLGLYEDSVGKYVILRNPYGKGDPNLSSLGKGPWIFYDKQYNIGTTCPATNNTNPVGKSFDFSAADGIFALDVTTFNNYFEGVGFIVL